MAILLSEARATLKNAVLQCGGSFNAFKLDTAIIETGERLINEGGLNRQIATAVTVADDKAVDISTTTSDFTYYDLIDVSFIAPGPSNPAWQKLVPVTLDKLRALHDINGDTSNDPEFMAWVSETVLWLFPTPDAVYTLNLVYKKPLTTGTWTAGTRGTYATGTTYEDGDVVAYTDSNTYRSTGDNNLNNAPDSTSQWDLIGATSTYPAPDPQAISLNIHKKWAIRWLKTGARSSMLSGAPGHPEVDTAREDFEHLIQEVENITAPVGVWYADGDENYERSYGPFGLN